MAEKSKKIQSRIWFFSLKNAENNIAKIKANLIDSGASECYCINHDKDTIVIDDIGTLAPKPEHTHFCVKYDNPTQFSVIQNIFCLSDKDSHLIQVCHNWRFACRYLLHLDQKDKFQYNISDIEVLKGSQEHLLAYITGNQIVKSTSFEMFPDFAQFDKVNYKEQFLQISNAPLDVREKNRLIKELKLSMDNYIEKRRLEMAKKKVNVILIEGKSGSGKSTYAESLCISNQKTYVRSSSSNDAIQDYVMEDVLILDDLRDDTFALNDLVKLLDNYHFSSLKARYKNKTFLGDLIIITTSVPICEWYKDTTEDRNQLFRRITGYIKCYREGNHCFARIYAPTPKELQPFMPFGNVALTPEGLPIAKNYVTQPVIEITPRQVEEITGFWGSLGVNIDEVVKDSINEQLSMDLDKKKKS